jgi:hypothetical protein
VPAAPAAAALAYGRRFRLDGRARSA